MDDDRQWVDKVFNDVKSDDQRDLTGYGPENPIYLTPDSPFKKTMTKFYLGMNEERYDRFAEMVAADDRIKPYLPSLALEALSDKWHPGSNGFSKEELEIAANNDTKFDAIYRRALRFAVSNFDNFRRLDPSDEIGLLGLLPNTNNAEITESDLLKGQQWTIDTERLRPRIDAATRIATAFSEIDTDESGKISNDEGLDWRFNPRTPYFRQVDQELPKKIVGRLMPGSELLSQKDYQDRISSYEQSRAKFHDFWNWK